MIILNRKEFLQRGGTYVFSTLCGVLTSAVVLLACAFLMFGLQLSLSSANYLSLFSLGCGCMVSGYICGNIKKHSGLKLGFQCALILLCICFIGSLISDNLNGEQALEKLLTALLTGCSGGVLGVNRS